MFLSDVEFLKNGFIKTSKDEAKAPYTIILLGETGVGKTTFIELIASVLVGKRVNLDDLDILDHTDDLTNQTQTNSAHLYEFTSKNGVVVSASICEHGSRCNGPLRFASSTRPVFPIRAIFSRANSTRRVF